MSELPHVAPESLSLGHVDSYEKLDIVLFVRQRAQPTPLEDIAACSGMTVADAKRTVAVLCTDGVLSCKPEGYVCEPANAALSASVDALVRAYQTNPLAVLGRIGKARMLRQRMSARHAFGVSIQRAMDPVTWRRGPRS